MFGGTGVVGNGRPFIGWFDTSVHGLASVFGGELQTDLGAGNTNLAIVDALDRGDGGGLIIIMENYDASDSGVRPIYLTQGGPFVPSDWKRATGLTAGLMTAGRVVLPGNSGPGHFHALFNNRDVWHINGTTGIPVCTLQANVLDVGFTPNEGLWMAEEAEGLRSVECHLLAIEDAAGNGAIVKSFDDLVTQDDILPGMTAWPVVGAKGKDVAIGPAAQSSTAAKVIVAGLLGTPVERFIAWREGAGNFAAKIFPTSLDLLDFFRLRAISSDVWFGFFFVSQTLITQTDTGLAVRTKDGGATWDDTYARPATGRAWQDIQRAADGRLWGVTIEDGNANHMEIWYNDDPEGDGAWTESKDSDPGADVGERYVQVLCHPTNPNRIAILGYEGASPLSSKISIWLTTDRGANWTNNVPAAKQLNGATGLQAAAMMLGSNRLVTTGWAVTTNKATVFTSDDNGLTWVARKTFDNATSGGLEWIYGPVGDSAGNRLFVMVEIKDASPYDIQIWESNDQGQTWNQTVGSALGNLPSRYDVLDMAVGGLAYDPTEGALYLYGLGEGLATVNYHVFKTVGLGWQDVSDALLSALTGHTFYSISDETSYGIAVIPS